MNTYNRHNLVFGTAIVLSFVMLWACSMPFVFFTEKLLILILYAVIAAVFIYGRNASTISLRYKKLGYIFVICSSFVLIIISSICNIFEPVYDRKIIGTKIYYIRGSITFNDEWYAYLVEYNIYKKKVVGTHLVDGLFVPELSIEQKGTELYIKETKHY